MSDASSSENPRYLTAVSVPNSSTHEAHSFILPPARRLAVEFVLKSTLQCLQVLINVTPCLDYPYIISYAGEDVNENFVTICHSFADYF